MQGAGPHEIQPHGNNLFRGAPSQKLLELNSKKLHPNVRRQESIE